MNSFIGGKSQIPKDDFSFIFAAKKPFNCKSTVLPLLTLLLSLVTYGLVSCLAQPALRVRTAPELPQYAQKMTSCVLPCFSGGTKPGLHAGGQIKSKANGT